MKQLKPLSFRTGPKESSSKYRDNIFQQNILLKAVQHTSDLEELKNVAKFHSTTEVLRTLDKLAIRRDFHNALANSGLDTNFLVQKLKALCASPSEKIALGGVQTALKSIGLDKYEVTETEGKDWEGLLLKINEKENMMGQIVQPVVEGAAYEVIIPEVPESARKVREEDDAIGKSLYE